MTAEADQQKPGKKKKLIVTISSTALWVLSIALAFAIKSGDRLIFVPDALLLLGFFPLLWLWRQGWATFFFGLFNLLIGFFLLILRYLDFPQGTMTREMLAMRDHLVLMHDCWTWILIGAVAMIWGLIDTGLAIAGWFKKRQQTSQS